MVDLSMRLPADAAVLTAALNGLVQVNATLMSRRSYPWLFDTRIRYRREPVVHGVREDRWLTADELLAQGYGDCEDLSGYMAGYLVAAGDDASGIVTQNPSGNFHARVVWRGRLWDPSRILIARERETR